MGGYLAGRLSGTVDRKRGLGMGEEAISFYLFFSFLFSFSLLRSSFMYLEENGEKKRLKRAQGRLIIRKKKRYHR